MRQRAKNRKVGRYGGNGGRERAISRGHVRNRERANRIYGKRAEMRGI